MDYRFFEPDVKTLAISDKLRAMLRNLEKDIQAADTRENEEREEMIGLLADLEKVLDAKNVAVASMQDQAIAVAVIRKLRSESVITEAEYRQATASGGRAAGLITSATIELGRQKEELRVLKQNNAALEKQAQSVASKRQSLQVIKAEEDAKLEALEKVVNDDDVKKMESYIALNHARRLQFERVEALLQEKRRRQECRKQLGRLWLLKGLWLKLRVAPW